MQEDFDLIRAWKHGKIQTSGELAGSEPVLLEPQFTRWMTRVLDEHIHAHLRSGKPATVMPDDDSARVYQQATATA